MCTWGSGTSNHLWLMCHCLPSGKVTVFLFQIVSHTVDSEKMSGSTTGEDLQIKIPKAWEKRGVAGVVANVTDCEPSMVKMGRLVMENTGIVHYGCVHHRLEKTSLKFYSHPSITESLSRAEHCHFPSQVLAGHMLAVLDLLFSLC